MTNLLPHAYLVEVIWLSEAVAAFALATWMIRDTGWDRHRLYGTASQLNISVPRSYFSQANGNILAEVWRWAEALGLIAAAVWAVLTSVDGKPVEFWSWEANTQPLRLLPLYITTCNFLSAVTARWFRHEAALLDN